MAVLTQITLDADGTLDTTNLSHDGGTGTPWFSHFNDAPDGVSADFLQHNAGLADGTYVSWHSLADVDADFGSMDTLNINVDVEAVGSVANDTVALTARIFDADNDTSNPLTAESATLGDQTDTTRTQPTAVSFASLTGSKAQWDAAHIRFSFAYNRVTSADAFNLRLYGLDIDGTYTVLTKAAGNYSVLGPGAYPRPPYASFAGKAPAVADGRLLLLNPPGVDGGFGTGLSL